MATPETDRDPEPGTVTDTQREVQVATRRPRVPKSVHHQSAHRALVPAGAPAGSGGQVSGHSAKVIPLDAAPSRHHGEDRAADAPRADPSGSSHPSRSPAGRPDAGRGDAGRGDAGRGDTGRGATVSQDRPASGSALVRAGTADPDRDGTAGGGSHRGAVGTPARIAVAGTPASTPAERRAAARRDVLRQARRGSTRAARQPDPPSSGSRPAVVEPVPARHFSGRSVALLVVLFVAAVLLAPTLRVFLDQQAELRAVQEDLAAQQAQQHELTEQIARWDDPAYVQQQARDRFNLVMPGEKAYMVIGGEDGPEDPVPAPANPSEINPRMPWADALWDSVVRAGTD